MRARRRELRALLNEWDLMDKDTRGPEPPKIRLAQNGIAVATALINTTANGFDDIPADVTRGKLAILVIEKMSLLGLWERSKASKDDAFKATHLVLQHYKVI
ncbi:hypothetical protein FS749_005635 [Ceratobasidium sp. UAMH 11750]|nr:hypothetical protein FS749_005635 [Ceratobasidium sp. UAMH 11750]